MPTKIEFGFGIGEDRRGRQLYRAEVSAAMIQICGQAATLFGGYTVFETRGGWVNPEGRLVEEPGRTLMVLDAGPIIHSDTRIKQIVALIKRTLRQRAVAVTLTPADMRIV